MRGAKTVLVGVVGREKDLDIARTRHWYRIPARHAPVRKLDYIALYQTSAFGREGKAVRYYARVKNISIAKRRRLLPDEKNHPRAEESYCRLELGPLKRTPRRIENRSRRRVSFGFTTLKKLLSSKEISRLFDIVPVEDMMQKALKRSGIASRHEFCIMDRNRCRYRLDFAVFCRNGKIAVECDSEKWHQQKRQKQRDGRRDLWLKKRGWAVIRFQERRLQEDMSGCIRSLRKKIRVLGGTAKGSSGNK